MDQGWLRIHAKGVSSLYWGLHPPRLRPSRWDAPDGSYGVLYVGTDAHAAFIETFGHTTGIRVLQLTDLATRAMSRLMPSRPLRLVRVTGSGLAQLGADARLFSADYAVSQRWSQAIYRHPSLPDGILYPARHDETRLCAALFDRIRDEITEDAMGTLADPPNAALLGALLNTYGFGLV
ncbi:MAG TPA: RES family NAD+ phosphorylase [Chloroflexota bacterium]|nr:RES family NAD+ phosphorylase [Chloroflexota bacterium]